VTAEPSRPSPDSFSQVSSSLDAPDDTVSAWVLDDGASQFGALSPVESPDRGHLAKKGEVRCWKGVQSTVAPISMEAGSGSDPVPARDPGRGVGLGEDSPMRVTIRVFASALLLVVTCVPSAAPDGADRSQGTSPISILLVGDIMLGRGVAPIATGDGAGLFKDVRLVVNDADLSFANLESPLTDRAHQSANPNTLEADPALASLIAGAGFDLVTLANNHIGDTGPGGVIDTITAVENAGMMAVGAGSDSDTAARPVLIEVGDMTVAALSFDATGGGLAAGSSPGVAAWQAEATRLAVAEAAGRSDLVVVAVHGGLEYLPEADPRMMAIAEQLKDWGADIVWGQGAHVVQPVILLSDETGRGAVVATSLGNFLFDQRGPLTGRGAVLEVLADDQGVIAHRVGSTSHRDLRVHFEEWELPSGDAALIDGEWWALVRAPAIITDRTADLTDFKWGVVVSASNGRITGSDEEETVVSFRHLPGSHPVRDGLPDIDWIDASGMSAHLGIYRSDDLEPIWVAGMVPAPIEEVAACDGQIALAYSTLDRPEVIATGAAVWKPFGLDGVTPLTGPGTPTCADVDGDELTEAVIIGRS
jgi:gamma-polyglutamate biosynthesis protein CapA